MNPDPYRGAFGSDVEKYVRDVQEVIDFGTSGHVAGFISETIQVLFLSLSSSCFILSSSNYCSYLFSFCLINYGHDVDVRSNSG